MIELMESLYSHTTTVVAQTPDDNFELTTGGRQGWSESPTLFNVFIDFIIRVFQMYRCTSIDSKFLQHDLALLFQETTNLIPRQTLFQKIRNIDGSILSQSETQLIQLFCMAIKTTTLALTSLSLFQPSNT